MDIASIIGLVVCLSLTLMAIIVGNGVAAIYRDFMDFQSALITFGGAFCAILAGNTIESFETTLGYDHTGQLAGQINIGHLQFTGGHIARVRGDIHPDPVKVT